MNFKKPKSKDLVHVAKGLFAFEGGKRVGRGIIGAIPAKDDAQAQLIKGGSAVLAVLAAASYQGKNKDLVLPAFVGFAAEQIGDIIDNEAHKMITRKPNPGVAEKFLYDSMGLGCPGTLNAPRNLQNYPMLASPSPSIRAIEWDHEVFGEAEVIETDYAGA